MRLTNTYTVVACSCDHEHGRESKKKGKYKAVNPWAVCTTSVGREDKEKYEDCVTDVKKKHKIKKD